MSNTSPMLSVKPDHPVDSLTIAAMREVDTLAKAQRLSYFVCGAIARDILLRHVHGIDAGSATRDVDFGIAVSGWDEFEAIKKALIDTGKFEPVKNMSQRLYYKFGANNRGYPIDIIPFGGVEDPPKSIAWPPDKHEVMNVIGYEEALNNTVEVQVEAEFVIPVVSLPGLALLKIFAWADRGNSNPKDARDLVTLCKQYANAGNQERLFEEAIDIMEAVDYDADLAAPQLLGRDVRAILTPDTQARLDKLLGDEPITNALVTHMAGALRGADDPIEMAEKLFSEFKAGLKND